MRIGYHALFWAGTLLMLGLLLWLFSGVLLPFVAAVVLGYLLDPVVERLEHFGLNRLGATLIIVAAFALLLVLLVILFAPVLWRQLWTFIDALPGYAVELQGLISGEIARLSHDYSGGLADKLGLGKDAGAEFAAATSDIVGDAAQWAASFLRSLLLRGAALINLISLLIITPVVTFYVLLDWDRMVAAADGLVPPRHRDTIRRLAREVDAAMAGFVRGQSLVCLFLASWYGIGLTLIGLNFGLLIGILAGVMSFIPYVGSLTALILAAAVAIVQDWPRWGLLASALAVVLTGQFLEGNILSPKLVGESVGLHPVWLIFALLAFGSLFGFTGLIVAVPAAATAGVILRFAVKRYRESSLYLEEAGAAQSPGLPLPKSAPALRKADR